VIDDRDEIGEALARAGPRRQNVGAAAPGNLDGILLVPVQAQGQAEAGLVLVAAEDALAFGRKDAMCDESVDGLARLEGRVELHKGIGPQATGFQLVVDEALDLRVLDAQEALDVGAVLVDNSVAQLKDIHMLPVVWRGRRPAMQACCGRRVQVCLWRAALKVSPASLDPMCGSRAARSHSVSAGYSGLPPDCYMLDVMQ
jgi:hypothetical protein